MKKNIQVLSLILVGALVLTACTQSKNDTKVQVKNSDESIEMQVIQNLSKNVILATYQGLSASRRCCFGTYPIGA